MRYCDVLNVYRRPNLLLWATSSGHRAHEFARFAAILMHGALLTSAVCCLAPPAGGGLLLATCSYQLFEGRPADGSPRMLGMFLGMHAWLY